MTFMFPENEAVTCSLGAFGALLFYPTCHFQASQIRLRNKSF